jgi:hypothetical protein
VTGERFTSDEIVGPINESESPLDYIGGHDRHSGAHTLWDGTRSRDEAELT